MSVVEHALDWARRGVPVVPCHPSGEAIKRPYLAKDRDEAGNPIPNTGGVKKATTDPAQIRAWWQQWPSALVGGAMGGDLRLLAIDPDAPEKPGEPDGVAAWNALVAEHGGIPATHAQETPGGGRHYVFTMPEGIDLGNKEGALKGRGINVRGFGGYLILAPSRLADGRAYRMVDEFDFGTFAPAPQWLLDLIVDEPQRRAEPEPDPEPEQQRQERRHAHSSARGEQALSRYVASAVDKECDLVANCGRGGRNNQLNTSAFNLGTLVGAGVLTSAEAVRQLYAAAQACGHVKDKGQGATMATIESGLTRGAERPRDLSKVRDRVRQKQEAKDHRRQARHADADTAGPGDNVGLVTEDEGAILFAERHRGELRYCWSHGAWFRWDGSIWRKNETAVAFHFARELARQMAEDADDKVRVTASKAAFAGSVERFARADPAFAVTAETWDQDPMLLGTPGGVVDLRTGVLRPAKPEDGITRSTAVAPADVTDCPLWLKFLDETFAGDAAVIAFAQRWAGYSLTGLTREHALVFGHGAGGNGKSVYVNVHVGIAADYAITASMDTFIASNGDRHSTDLAMLRGARMVTASETEEGRQWAESRIKQMTGGDRITARFMRQDFFTFLPTFKLLIIGNHKPGLRNVDDAARRRFNLVPFTNKPAVKDVELEDKLKAEWPAILRWMIEGCLTWQRDGLAPPESVKEATAAYFEDQDILSEWLADKCIVDKGSRTRMETTADLFASWTIYAKAANEPPGTVRSFAQTLDRHGFTPEKHVPTFGGKNARGFRGVSVIAPAHREVAE